MSISSDVEIERIVALESIRSKLVREYSDMITKALNATSNSDLGAYLHSDVYFYGVTGKGKIKESWEE